MTLDPSHGFWRRHAAEAVTAWDFAFCLLCPSRSPLCCQKHAYSSFILNNTPLRAIPHRLVTVQATGLRGVAVMIPPVFTFKASLHTFMPIYYHQFHSLTLSFDHSSLAVVLSAFWRTTPRTRCALAPKVRPFPLSLQKAHLPLSPLSTMLTNPDRSRRVCHRCSRISDRRSSRIGRKRCQGSQSQAYHPASSAARHPWRWGAGYPDPRHYCLRRCSAAHQPRALAEGGAKEEEQDWGLNDGGYPTNSGVWWLNDR